MALTSQGKGINISNLVCGQMVENSLLISIFINSLCDITRPKVGQKVPKIWAKKYINLHIYKEENRSKLPP